MADLDNQAPNDPWLTVAEIAEELRVNPATVRLWISEGKLGATRAGPRKLLVRRSAVDRMVEQSGRGGRSVPVESYPLARARLRSMRMRLSSATGALRAKGDADEVRAAVVGMQRAAAAWDAALDASENAPPDPGFGGRLRAIAKASRQEARALERAELIPQLGWTPLPEAEEMVLSHELRPGGNRPGPAGLWQSFDMTVERLSVAMQGHIIGMVSHEYRELADILDQISDALDRKAVKRPGSATLPPPRDR
jgi:excisionase family DNA binding protein